MMSFASLCGNAGAGGERRVLDESDQVLAEALKTGARNESKCELVFGLRAGQSKGRIVASARHLGNQYSWKGRKDLS